MKEALKLALEALEWFTTAEQGNEPPINKAITAIKEALAQPEQEPWCMKMNGCKTKCEDCPDEAAKPQRPWGKPWVSLTDEEYEEIWRMDLNNKDIMDKTIAKLKEKNT